MKTTSSSVVAMLLLGFLILMGAGAGLIVGFYAGLFAGGSYSGWWLFSAPVGALLGGALGMWLGNLLSNKLFGDW